RPPSHRHPFPTRRSSDLPPALRRRADGRGARSDARAQVPRRRARGRCRGVSRRGRQEEVGRVGPPSLDPPASLLAEITHRCPIHCLYCSNPLELTRRADELPTEVWLRVLAEAADLGVLQVHLSGGEPLARADLAAFVERATALELY